DVGLIMFPLTELGTYADLTTYPEYGFSNPLAIEFGFWGFLLWGFYFLTCFYFCLIEPKVQFFELKPVKFLNNIVIIGTCAFTAYLLLSNLSWYMPSVVTGSGGNLIFFAIVFAVIGIATFSSMELKYVRILSLASSGLFVCLIILLGLNAAANGMLLSQFLETFSLIGGYFTHIDQFVLPINAYHEFYLYWWFAWSIMIGQFTARFVGGLKTYQVFAAMVIVPSIPIALWFTVLYYHHANDLSIDGLLNGAMVFVGITFVINSLDSLIRLYTDNLNLTVMRFGRLRYWLGNFAVLGLLTLAFQGDFLEIQWVGAVVIALYFACFLYILGNKRQTLRSLK
ncbi:MAG: BCCT family transporter, partial [Kordiimonas sp.]